MNGTEEMGPDKLQHPRPRSDEEKSMGQLFKELSRDVLHLAAHELGLTKLEISRKASDVFKYSRFYTAGIFVVYAGFIFVLAALVLELSELIPISLSAFLVGIAALVTGLIFIRVGRKRMREEALSPPKAVQIFRSDRERTS